jgi:energy-coupling factor transport system substrate-specific component
VPVFKKIFEYIPIKTIVLVLLGISLVVLFTGISLQAGFIPHTRIQFNAAIIAIIGVILGPVSGAITAFIGHSLGDAIFSDKIWWSWVIADTLYGFAAGFVHGKIRISQRKFSSKFALLFNLNQFFANALAWIFVAPLLDVLFYSEPSDLVFAQGITAFAVNGAVTLTLGTTLLFIYSRILSVVISKKYNNYI